MQATMHFSPRHEQEGRYPQPPNVFIKFTKISRVSLVARGSESGPDSQTTWPATMLAGKYIQLIAKKFSKLPTIFRFVFHVTDEAGYRSVFQCSLNSLYCVVSKRSPFYFCCSPLLDFSYFFIQARRAYPMDWYIGLHGLPVVLAVLFP